MEPTGEPQSESGAALTYPHLAPELRALQGDALAIWGDAAIRRDALGAPS